MVGWRRGVNGTRVFAVGVLAMLAASPLAASRPPIEITLQLDGGFLRWDVVAATDVYVLDGAWRSVPADLLGPLPALNGSWRRDERRSGVVALQRIPPGAWIELRLRIASETGETWIGGTLRVPLDPRAREAASVRRLRPARIAAPTPGVLRGRCLYEQRLLGREGYTGGVQLLPLRHVDAELVGPDSTVLARSSVGPRGELEMPLPANSPAPLFVRLLSTTRHHPPLDLAVLTPPSRPGTEAALHELRTPEFAPDAAGVDLGDVVFRDPDGFGAVQAFHILDLAVDTWDALADPGLVGTLPTDSLRFYWGPQARISFSGSSGSAIEITSPASGDTDAWSDAVVLHEIGHFVAHRYLRDDSRGGVHLLGDIEQDLRLAYSEGLATAWAFMVRDWRAAHRRNLQGDPVDLHVAWYIDAGLPPPDGVAGGLEFGWNAEDHTWIDGSPIPRVGIGSESNVTATLWDLADDGDTPDGEAGDDDGAGLGAARVFELLRAMRAQPGPATLESFWHAGMQQLDPTGRAALQAVFLLSQIEFFADTAEPDDVSPAILVPALPVTSPGGGVVIDEIDAGTTPAVEITNRGPEPVDVGGWMLQARRNGTSTNPALTFTFPRAFQLGPGARVVVHRHDAQVPNGPRELLAPDWTLPWFPESDGALVLLDAQGKGVDFVRWDGRNGALSEAPPPPGTSFSGRLAAPGYGRTLTRRADRMDQDDAGDFSAAPPSLGVPNELPTAHRTFFPENDVDAVRWRVERAGVYTLQTLQLRNGALPHLEIADDRRRRPEVRPRQPVPWEDGARLSLWLDAGDAVTARLVHAGTTTRYGAYDLVLFAEPDAGMPLPPEGLRAVAGAAAAGRKLQVEWWNAALYDSVQVRLEGERVAVLPGHATRWRKDVPDGTYTLQVAGFARGTEAAAPELLVVAEDLPYTFADDFDVLSRDDWEMTGGWDTVSAPGRPGGALTDSPAGRYGTGTRAEVRLRRAVLVQPGAMLCFDHICIVRPEDIAVLEVTDDWGARWETVGRWDLRTHGGGSAGAANWSDGRPDPEDWVHECVPLDRFAGRPIQVRFRLVADIYGEADGWYLDALRIAPAGLAPRAGARLGPVVPNPFNPRTRIEFTVGSATRVQLDLYDVRGRLVRSLVDSQREPGVHHAVWDGLDARGRAVASGTYLALLRAGGERRRTKLVLLR